MIIPRRNLILDLCGGSRSWSNPYREKGYKVFVVDSDNYFSPDFWGTVSDFYRRLASGRLVLPPVRGVLADPPCPYEPQMLERLVEGRRSEAWLAISGCMDLIKLIRPNWWALANPPFFIESVFGKPFWRIQPWEYGDPYTKAIAVWGTAVRPPPSNPVVPTKSGKSVGFASRKRFSGRLKTPPGFARAFCDSNP